MPKPPWALWALDREWGPSWRVQGSGHTVPKRLGGKGYDSLLLWGRGGGSGSYSSWLRLQGIYDLGLKMGT